MVLQPLQRRLGRDDEQAAEMNHAERLRNIAAQIGQPDYSLVELRRDLRELADDPELDRGVLCGIALVVLYIGTVRGWE